MVVRRIRWHTKHKMFATMLDARGAFGNLRIHWRLWLNFHPLLRGHQYIRIVYSVHTFCSFTFCSTEACTILDLFLPCVFCSVRHRYSPEARKMRGCSLQERALRHGAPHSVDVPVLPGAEPFTLEVRKESFHGASYVILRNLINYQ